jgi:glutamine phosphoribosylpyrophosphate amidotransferase
MCGVLGVKIKDVTKLDLVIIKELILQTQIRGMHATGVSYVRDGTIYTSKESLNATKFLEMYKVSDFVDTDNTLTMIVHCRYSTSCLTFNQPIVSDDICIVHNGVVTQELYENWESLYGYKCSTENDSELILKTIQSNLSPLHEWRDSSMAVIELHKDKSMVFYRNGKRPLHLLEMGVDRGFIIGSTGNIFNRVGLKSESIRHNVYYHIDGFTLNTVDTDIIDKDLQNGL